MKTIDVSSWPRREHFNFFCSFQQPHMTMSVELDAEVYCRSARSEGVSLFLALVFAVTKAANGVPEFRTRMRSNGRNEVSVVEHAVVNPVVTVPVSGDLFNFCALQYHPVLPEFVGSAQPRLRAAEQRQLLFDETAGQDDVIYLTSAPWLVVKSITLPVRNSEDCVPRIVWSKIAMDDGRPTLNVTVMVHHGLCDALHVARFFEGFQGILAAPLHSI